MKTPLWALSLLCGAAWGGCLATPGSHITAGDLASAYPAFASLDPNTELVHAPVPGARRVMNAAELQQLARHWGMEAPLVKEICFERVLAEINEPQILAAMRYALRGEDVSIDLVERSRLPVPPGHLEFPRTGILTVPTTSAKTPVLWRGQVSAEDGRTYSVWARVRLTRYRLEAVAIRAVTLGHVFTAEDVEMRDVEIFALDAQPPTSAEMVIGKCARRAIPAGQLLSARLLAEPKEVQRGDRVQVDVISGAAQLSLDALADSAGGVGEKIVVRNPETGRSFRAIVIAKGKVEVNATEQK